MNKTIGIVGGGQLGRMLTVAAHKLGFQVIVLDPTPNSPAGQIADKQLIGNFTDEEKIKELARMSDFVTFEIELANASVLEDIKKSGAKINPSPTTLAIIKDKLKQKQFLRKYGIPTADFMEISKKEDLAHAFSTFGYPFLLKAREGGYDGRGNALIKKSADIPKALKKLTHRKTVSHPEERSDVGSLLYAEKFAPFVKELAVMAARSTVGEILTYPVVETTHKNNICHTCVVPAAISEKAYNNARSLASLVMEHLEGAGVFGIEMFLTKNDEVLVNEIAPRVHNSGHYTIEACKTSQFEQHIRAITGMELGPTDLVVPAAAMVNILGERSGAAKPAGVEKAEALQGVSVHLYGKHETKLERKMGHITAVGDTPQEALEKAQKARKYISI